MCEINPKHSHVFKLEVFTSNPNMTREQFEKEMYDRVLAYELELNKDGKFRFHIHEVE